MQTYPLPSTRHLVERLPGPPADRPSRRWCLRASNGGVHHGAVPLSQDPVVIHLFWKEDTGDEEREVGCYRLNLHRLLAEGFVRYDATGRPSTHARVQFRRHDDGVVYVQTTLGEPGLPVGEAL